MLVQVTVSRRDATENRLAASEAAGVDRVRRNMMQDVTTDFQFDGDVPLSRAACDVSAVRRHRAELRPPRHCVALPPTAKCCQCIRNVQPVQLQHEEWRANCATLQTRALASRVTHRSITQSSRRALDDVTCRMCLLAGHSACIATPASPACQVRCLMHRATWVTRFRRISSKPSHCHCSSNASYQMHTIVSPACLLKRLHPLVFESNSALTRCAVSCAPRLSEHTSLA